MNDMVQHNMMWGRLWPTQMIRVPRSCHYPYLYNPNSNSSRNSLWIWVLLPLSRLISVKLKTLELTNFPTIYSHWQLISWVGFPGSWAWGGTSFPRGLLRACSERNIQKTRERGNTKQQCGIRSLVSDARAWFWNRKHTEVCPSWGQFYIFNQWAIDTNH